MFNRLQFCDGDAEGVGIFAKSLLFELFKSLQVEALTA